MCVINSDGIALGGREKGGVAGAGCQPHADQTVGTSTNVCPINQAINQRDQGQISQIIRSLKTRRSIWKVRSPSRGISFAMYWSTSLGTLDLLL